MAEDISQEADYEAEFRPEEFQNRVFSQVLDDLKGLKLIYKPFNPSEKGATTFEGVKIGLVEGFLGVNFSKLVARYLCEFGLFYMERFYELYRGDERPICKALACSQKDYVDLIYRISLANEDNLKEVFGECHDYFWFYNLEDEEKQEVNDGHLAVLGNLKSSFNNFNVYTNGNAE